MVILHTESSSGWGGQEIRILREAEGMRALGYEIVFAIAEGGGLVQKAKNAGFTVYEVAFKKARALPTLMHLVSIIRKHKVQMINTHSSLDAWIGGIAGRVTGRKIIRTRHLSTPIRKGLNSLLLYKALADFVVTTSSAVVPLIASQARISKNQCRSIPTGVDPSAIQVMPGTSEDFRNQWGLGPHDILVGTACFVRSWKGIYDLMDAAEKLRERKEIKWVVIGGGYVADYAKVAKERRLDDILFFTGHLDSPFAAIAALDIFTLLSTAHEGVSQASLQAAYLHRPMITTTVGGLPEVCIHEVTGLQVPPRSPEKIVEAVLRLADDPSLRRQMGQKAHELVLEKFTWQHTLDEMQNVYDVLNKKEGKCLT
jgi:glycosyltransferase involved in cell wall biosynthesis